MVVFSKFTAVLASLAAVSSAMPTGGSPKAESPKTRFSIKQTARPASKPKTVNLPAMYAATIAKYGGKVPDSVKAAASRGSAITTPTNNDEEYLTPVTVGGSTLNLDFDTGSADLWVFSSELPSSESQGHDLYSPSPNAQKLSGYSWSISYGDGSNASGDVYEDTVSVGGVTASRQAVEAAQSVSQQFVSNVGNDGLLGLAFSSINTVQPQAQTTFFDTVQSQLDSPLFAVTLKHNAPGTYDFGFIDSSKYTGQLAFTPVDNSQGFWSFNADGYSVGYVQGAGITGIADTGTTLLLLDDSVVYDYYSQVSGAQSDSSAGGITIPCDAQLPDFVVTINGYDAVVPGSLINYAPLSGNTCFGGIQSNSGIGFSIFGDIFLKSQYVVFDASGPQLGFAAQA
ncbi:Penicillopepsin-2 [Penicillium diatomitis]|uniref:penicillopepsin n=1 Tax=Penicillium diatomitis TaxID=2819901 RepID=A0A9X0BXT7_9EURO|nr:Penicillopepsin-2 [Penicillium diatomitis]KAJ5489100.1 Penicillopepsin-2 [Penicillium diatomitis]